MRCVIRIFFVVLSSFCLVAIPTSAHKERQENEKKLVSDSKFIFLKSEEGEALKSEHLSVMVMNCLANTRMPGGMAMKIPCEEQLYEDALVGHGKISLSDALNRIVSKEKSYIWMESESVINFIPKDGVPSFLDSRIEHFKGTGIFESLVDQMIQLPEIERSAKLLNLKPAPIFGSFLSSGDEKKLSVDLKDIKLKDALNFLVRENGSGMWFYAEYNCDGQTQFKIEVPFNLSRENKDRRRK